MIFLSFLNCWRPIEEYAAVPLFHILDDNNFHKLVPAAACMLMLTVTGAFLELFPELYRIIVRFATSEWRILTKQIAYESSESGNPVLAVFIAGKKGNSLITRYYQKCIIKRFYLDRQWVQEYV